jgi:predicted MFS family arabinose efflux permease
MNSPKDKTETISTTVEDIAERILLWSGIVSLFIGVSGLILVITYPEMYGDDILQFGVSFVYSYMIIVGIFLILYHSKIIVRGYPT